MMRRLSAVVVLSLTVAASPYAQAANTRTIVGKVTDISPAPLAANAKGDEHSETLVVWTEHEGEVAVTTTSRTLYQKWITRQPWQQSTRADASLVRVGRRVAVHFSEEGESRVATLIRIATE